MTTQIQTRGTLLDDSNFASTIHHLAQYHTEDGVLSVYLDIPAASASGDACEKELRRLLEPLHSHTNDAWLQGRLEYEIAGAIEAARSWQHPPGRAVAMFFCGPGGLDAVVPLRFHIQPFARFARRPVLNPLIAALDDQRRYCVVIFERRRARIISVMLGEVEDEVTIESDLTGRSDLRKWGAEASGVANARQSDLHAHAMRTIEQLWAIDRSRPIHGLMFAGDAEALVTLKQLLPRSLSHLEVNAPVIDGNAIALDVAHCVHLVEEERREAEDGTLVGRLLEDRENDLAVMGWDPTLEAINDGRVQVLVLPGEGARPGFFCPQDHFVTLKAANACPVCGTELRPTEHVGEAAIRSTLLRDGQVHVLAPVAAATFRPFGAGAVLRF
jgi:release factor family 10